MSVVTVTGREMPFWLGNIPSGWEVVPTKRVMTVVKQTPGQGKVDDYDRLSLTMQGVLPRSKDDRNGLQPVDFDAYQILRPGQLVFKLIDLMNVSTSRVGLSHHTGLVSPAYIVVSPGPKVEARFAHYYFRDLYSRRIFNLLGSVGVRSSLGPRDLMALEFLLPPLEEQHAIADYLDQETAQIDALVAKQEELILGLQQRRVTVATSAALLGLRKEGGCERDVLRWGRSLAVEPWLRKSPTSWGLERFKTVCRLREVRNVTGDELMLSLTVRGELVDRSTMSVQQNASDDSIPRYFVARPEDLVVNPMWLIGGAIGVSRMRGAVSPDYRVFEIDSRLDPWYLHAVLRSAPYFDQYKLYTRSNTTFDRRIKQNDLDNLPLPIPSIDEQQEIVAHIDEQASKIDALVVKAEEHIALAKERRSALITAAVTGQLDVRTARRGA